MSLKIYEYKQCGTCKKALNYLDRHNIAYKKIAIRETPPSKAELKKMLRFMDGNLKKLFNTSGQDYRQLNIKEKLPELSQDEALELLSQNGNLIKRPFVISPSKGVVGFKEESWDEIF